MNPKLKFIYWFSYYNPASPSFRYRGQYPLEFFKDKYAINSFISIPGYSPIKIFKFIKAYFSALFFRKANSLIVIQRINSNFIYANLLKFLVKVRQSDTIYDIDDADYLEYPPETIYYFLKTCSVITVGSHELAGNLSKFNKQIILSTSPTPDLKIVKKYKNKLLTIGWIGGFGGGHKEGLLKYFFPALKELPITIRLILLGVAKKSEYEFLTVYFEPFVNVLLEMPQDIDWLDEKEIQQRISIFDIGIATLLDNEMQRSKSAFKSKQYLNNGVPVLSSDIPENNLFIEHGKNGFLCSTPADFKQRIIEINQMDQDEYKLLSERARNSTPQFDLAKYCDNLIAIYEKKG
jgi:glycosyltransferase involved in cell wall biosynthesis